MPLRQVIQEQNQVLNIAPDSAEAYLGLAMGDKDDATREDCERSFLDGRYQGNKNFLRAKQFAQGDLKLWIENLEEERQAQLAAQQKARESFRPRIEPLWKALRQESLISTSSYHTVGLRADGTVVAVGANVDGKCNVSEWRDIVAVCAGGWRTFGLRADGTVVAVGGNEFGQCDVNGWKLFDNVESMMQKIATDPKLPCF